MKRWKDREEAFVKGGKANTAYSYFIDKGLTPAQAAGV